MTSSIRILLPSVFAVVLGAGCSTATSIVKKPEINQMKKIAVVSYTAPQRVQHKTRKNLVIGWGTTNRNVIADQALAAYTAEFKKLGWDTIPASQLSALPAYQANFAPKLSKASNGIANTLNKLSASDAENTFFSPTGLFPIVWDENKGKDGALRLDLGSLSIEGTKTLKAQMQEVAAKAGADAAVLVEANYCYDDGSFWVGKAGSGTGTAVLTGGAAVYAVTPNGTEVIKMKRPQGSCAEHHIVSDSSTQMLNGHLVYKDDKIQKMFQEVAQKTAAENAKLLRDAMRD